MKNENDLLEIFIAFFIIKVSFENKTYLENNNDFYYLKGHSDDLINNVIYYFKKLILWLEFRYNINMEFNNKVIRYLIISSVLILAKKKNIKTKSVRLLNKTYKLYSIDFNFKINMGKKISIFLTTTKYSIHFREKNTYICSKHFSSIEEIYVENILSGHSILIKNQQEFLEQLTNYWVYIDKSKIKLYYDCLMIEKELKNTEELVGSITNIENIIKINLEKKKDIKSVSEASKELSILLKIKELDEILNLDFDNKKIYLPFMFDFRGRLYYLSKFSPSFNKAVRYALHWGVYEKLEGEKHAYNSIIENQLDIEMKKIEDWKFLNFKNKKKEIKHAVIWLLISIAENFKTELGSEVKMQTFINKGMEVVEKFEHFYKKGNDVDSFIKIKNLIDILFEIEKDIYISRLISKDATASVYQHLIKTLGWKDSEFLKWCNLKSYDTWYDTYSHIIACFKKKIKLEYINEDEFKEIFNRSNLKNVIMTSNYGAMYIPAWKRFCEKINIYNYNFDAQEEIKTLFKFFFNFIKKEEDFFLNPSRDIFEKIEELDYKIEIMDEAIINLSYFTTEKKTIEIYLKNNRYTKQEQYITNILDKKKINSSVRANYVHTLDSALVRWFIKQQKTITIHDCFMIDYLNITYLLIKINEGMRITFHDLGLEKRKISNELFSIFILL